MVDDVTTQPAGGGLWRRPVYKVGHVLGDETRFWGAASVTFGIFAILKGLRKPSFWATTQAQLDYSHGLIKRGMLGAIYSRLGVHRYRPLSAIFFVELVVFFAVLVVFTRQSGIMRRFGSPAVVALFASSYAVTYLTYLVGYTDLMNATIAMVLLMVPRPRDRFLLALPLLPFALLVHENFLLLSFPVVLLSFYINRCTARTADEERKATVYGVLLALLAVGVTLATSLRPSLTGAQIAEMHREIAGRVDFPLREDFFPLLALSFGQNLRIMLQLITHMRYWWWMLSISLMVLVPVAWALVHFVLRLLDEGVVLPRPKETRPLRWAVLAVLAAPLGMHLLGWDQVRWNSLCVFAGYLTLGTLCLHAPGPELRLSTAERSAIIALLALNMATGWGLFNAGQVTPYPFYPVLKHYEVDPRVARMAPEHGRDRFQLHTRLEDG